ncbi:MAG TPA: restriction endonuclease [Nanoarchaeota archaeon]|nr:restriction endonuclease [Nanoarchaeota archaeon]
MPQIYAGISTRKIYRMAFRELKKLDNPSASRYEAKWAILRLEKGGEGFSFEQFVGKIFERMGYNIRRDQIMQGKSGITHEIDIVAEKGNETILIECKHHSRQGMWVNVQTPLYVYARYLDLKGQCTGAIIVTNSRFSEQSEVYAKSVGLKLIGWDYPPWESLRELVDKYAVYPVTVLRSVGNAALGRLLVKDVVTVADVLAMPASKLYAIIGKSAESVKKEAESVALS